MICTNEITDTAVQITPNKTRTPPAQTRVPQLNNPMKQHFSFKKTGVQMTTQQPDQIQDPFAVLCRAASSCKLDTSRAVFSAKSCALAARPWMCCNGACSKSISATVRAHRRLWAGSSIRNPTSKAASNSATSLSHKLKRLQSVPPCLESCATT